MAGGGSAAASSASGFAVSGQVTGPDGNALSGVTISDGNGNTTTTNSSTTGPNYELSLQNDTYTLTASKTGYADSQQTITVDGAAVPNTDFTLDGNLRGTVTDQNGDPVADATVKVFGFNYSAYDQSLTQAEIEDKVDQLQENISNPEPPDWDPNKQLDGPDSLSENAYGNETTYAVAHTVEDWHLNGWHAPHTPALDVNPTLDNPGVTFAEDETVVVSLWDPGEESLLEDDADSDLPGGTTTGAVVVKRMGAGGSTLSTTTKNTTGWVKITDVPNLGTKTHGAAVLDGLQPGFYKVHPKGNPGVSYTFAVAPDGNPSALTERMVEDLKDEQGNLEQRAQEISDAISNDKLSVKTTQSNDDGSFSFVLNSSNVDEVSVTAYQAPSTMSVDPNSPPTQQDIANHWDSTVETARERLQTAKDDPLGGLCDGATEDTASGHAPAGITRTDVPGSNVEVDVVGEEIPNHANVTNALCYKEDYLDYLRNNGFDEVLAWAQQNLSDLSRSEVEELYSEAIGAAEGSELACYQLFQETGVDGPGECEGGASDDNGDGYIGGGGGGGGVPAPGNVGNASEAEMRETINDMQETIDSLRDTIGSEEGETIVENGTISKSWFFDTDLSESEVILKAQFSDGTTHTMSPDTSQYVTTDSRFGRPDVVRMTDYPIGDTDPAAVSFNVIVAGDDGLGSETSPVVNPSFSGNVPALDAVHVSTQRPAAGDRVQVGVRPEDGATYGTLEDVTVTAPNGTELPSASITDGKNSAFTTASEGVHHVELTFSNAGGTNFTEVVRVRAGSNRRSLPPTIRGQEGPTGVYAVVSNGLDSGSIDVSGGGSTASVEAVVTENGDVPARVDVHMLDVDVSPSSRTEFRLVRGDTNQGVRKSITVQFHAPVLGDNPTLYRHGSGKQALPRDGENAFGVVTANNSQTVIETYTEGDGTVALSTNADPGFIDRAIYRVRMQAPWLPGLAMTPGDAAMGYGLGAGGVSLALLGAGLVCTRRWDL